MDPAGVMFLDDEAWLGRWRGLSTLRLGSVLEPPLLPVCFQAHTVIVSNTLPPQGSERFAVVVTWTMGISRIHHVLLAIPPGSEEQARAFFGELLGLVEIPKPPHLAKRGGVWYRCGLVDLHLGVDAEFRPAQKAHLALCGSHLAALRRRLRESGVHTWEDEPLPRHKRFYANDPFGNRVEFVEPEGT